MGESNDDEARREAARRWAEAQADIARHDAEFEKNNPNWDEQHGGSK